MPLSRLHFVRDLPQASCLTSDERHSLDHCLVQLLGGLCDILVQFAAIYRRHRAEGGYARQSNSNLDPSFMAFGRSFGGGERYMVRRSLDHLTLCIVNIGVGYTNILPTSYHNLRNKIQDVGA